MLLWLSCQGVEGVGSTFPHDALGVDVAQHDVECIKIYDKVLLESRQGACRMSRAFAAIDLAGDVGGMCNDVIDDGVYCSVGVTGTNNGHKQWITRVLKPRTAVT